MTQPRPLPVRKASPPPPIDLNPRTDPPLDFPDADFGALGAADYDRLGLLCGVEVHQQLATTSKLFCRCPSGVVGRSVDAEVLRHMRPTLSEMGEYDGTALMEFKTRKQIIYLLDRRTVCTYEMDDTPPFPIDEQAVRFAIEIARLFGLDLVSELHVMRKQYLDGSIPTGFQRTGMVGLSGAIPFRDSELAGDRVLRIRQLSLEEDSCREVSDIGHRITFRTDRLGMPLIETVTEPDLLTPMDAARGIRLLASVARASGRVRRGAGAARQDVNVSIAGSRRIEIKGVPSIRLVPRLVHNEAYRHLNLLRLRAALHDRGIGPDAFAIPDGGWPWEQSDMVAEVRAQLRGCRHPAVRAAIDRGERVCAVRVPGFEGLITHPTQPGQTFEQELAERVRVIACPTHHPFLATSDADTVLGSLAWRELRQACGAGEGDAVVLVWGELADAATAAREVLIRAADATVGVPSETRQAHADGGTGFERILPGPQRMYPDTDTPPLPIPDSWVAAADASLGEAPWRREARYRDLGLGPALATAAAHATWAPLLDAIAPSADAITTRRLAFALMKRLPPWHRSRRDATQPTAARLTPLVAALRDGSLLPSALEAVLDRVLREEQRPVGEILAEHRPGPLPAEAELIRALPAEASRRGDPGAPLRCAMGRLQRGRRRGIIDPLALRAALMRLTREARR